MRIARKAQLLRLHFGESEKRGGKPLYEVIVDRCKELGIAGATGVSGGSAHTIPTLLLPDQIGGRSMASLTDLTRLPDEAVDEALGQIGQLRRLGIGHRPQGIQPAQQVAGHLLLEV